MSTGFARVAAKVAIPTSRISRISTTSAMLSFQSILLQGIDRFTDDGAADPVVLRENVFGRQFVARIQCAVHDSMSNALGKLFAETSKGEPFIGHLMR